MALEVATKNALSKNNATTDGIGVQAIDPAQNKITLKNDRVIEYENLVVAVGQHNDFSIKGFEENWADPETNFHVALEHPSWKLTEPKGVRYINNFTGGQAYFYIPPEPYSGHIENYNFFTAKSIWDRSANNGRISWDASQLTIINANRSFAPHFPQLDEFIRAEAERRNIKIEEGLRLI